MLLCRLDGAKRAGGDLGDAEISGLDVRRLATSNDLKANPEQQFALLDAMGADVRLERYRSAHLATAGNP